MMRFFVEDYIIFIIQTRPWYEHYILFFYFSEDFSPFYTRAYAGVTLIFTRFAPRSALYSRHSFLSECRVHYYYDVITPVVSLSRVVITHGEFLLRPWQTTSPLGHDSTRYRRRCYYNNMIYARIPRMKIPVYTVLINSASKKYLCIM